MLQWKIITLIALQHFNYYYNPWQFLKLIRCAQQNWERMLPCTVLGCRSNCDTGHFPGVLCQRAVEHRREDQLQPSSNIMQHSQQQLVCVWYFTHLKISVKYNLYLNRIHTHNQCMFKVFLGLASSHPKISRRPLETGTAVVLRAGCPSWS